MPTACLKICAVQAHFITQDICNKFTEIKFSVGCMVSKPNCLLQCLTTMSLINKIKEIFKVKSLRALPLINIIGKFGPGGSYFEQNHTVV